MKTLCTFGLVVSLFAIGAMGQEIVDDHMIVVGTWESTVPADYATIDLDVEGFGATLAEAIQSARFNVQNISNRLQRFGFQENQITLSQFVSGENYFNNSWFTSKKDYRTKMSIQVQVNDLVRLDTVLIALHDQDITRVSKVEFFLTNPDLHKETALTNAITQAQAKAQLFAETLGIPRGILYRVEEIGEPDPMRLSIAGERVLSQYASFSVFSNRIPVKGEVKLIYHIQAPQTTWE